jgi:hypothetical protein
MPKKRTRKSKTKLPVLVTWMQAHRKLWLGWRDEWRWVLASDNCFRIWTACVNGLKKDGLVCPTSHAVDINVAKLIQKTQEHDYIGVLLAEHAETLAIEQAWMQKYRAQTRRACRPKA